MSILGCQANRLAPLLKIGSEQEHEDRRLRGGLSRIGSFSLSPLVWLLPGKINLAVRLTGPGRFSYKAYTPIHYRQTILVPHEQV